MKNFPELAQFSEKIEEFGEEKFLMQLLDFEGGNLPLRSQLSGVLLPTIT